MSRIDAERLAYWFLRLNGFLTTVNFIVHPERGDAQRTDADVLGVRTNPNAENLQRVLRAIGAFSEDALQAAAAAVYENGRYV